MKITKEGLEKVKIEFQNVKILTQALNIRLKICQQAIDECKSTEQDAGLVLDAEDDILETMNLLK